MAEEGDPVPLLMNTPQQQLPEVPELPAEGLAEKPGVDEELPVEELLTGLQRVHDETLAPLRARSLRLRQRIASLREEYGLLPPEDEALSSRSKAASASSSPALYLGARGKGASLGGSAKVPSAKLSLPVESGMAIPGPTALNGSCAAPPPPPRKRRRLRAKSQRSELFFLPTTVQMLDHEGLRAKPKEDVRFLPKVLFGDPVLIHEGRSMYRIDNPKKHPFAFPGIAYRCSKDDADKDEDRFARRGTTVEGTDEGDGWIRVLLPAKEASPCHPLASAPVISPVRASAVGPPAKRQRLPFQPAPKLPPMPSPSSASGPSAGQEPGSTPKSILSRATSKTGLMAKSSCSAAPAPFSPEEAAASGAGELSFEDSLRALEQAHCDVMAGLRSQLSEAQRKRHREGSDDEGELEFGYDDDPDSVNEHGGVLGPEMDPPPGFETTVDAWNRERDRNRIDQKVGVREWGDSKTLFVDPTLPGAFICWGYRRILYGDHGPYVEADHSHICWEFFPDIRRRSKWAYYDEHYTTTGSIKLYDQKKTVGDKPNPPPGEWSVRHNRIATGYAGYQPGRIYISADAVQAMTEKSWRQSAMLGMPLYDVLGNPIWEGYEEGALQSAAAMAAKPKFSPAPADSTTEELELLRKELAEKEDSDFVVLAATPKSAPIVDLITDGTPKASSGESHRPVTTPLAMLARPKFSPSPPPFPPPAAITLSAKEQTPQDSTGADASAGEMPGTSASNESESAGEAFATLVAKPKFAAAPAHAGGEASASSKSAAIPTMVAKPKVAPAPASGSASRDSQLAANSEDSTTPSALNTMVAKPKFASSLALGPAGTSQTRVSEDAAEQAIPLLSVGELHARLFGNRPPEARSEAASSQVPQLIAKPKFAAASLTSAPDAQVEKEDTVPATGFVPQLVAKPKCLVQSRTPPPAPVMPSLPDTKDKATAIAAIGAEQEGQSMEPLPLRKAVEEAERKAVKEAAALEAEHGPAEASTLQVERKEEAAAPKVESKVAQEVASVDAERRAAEELQEVPLKAAVLEVAGNAAEEVAPDAECKAAEAAAELNAEKKASPSAVRSEPSSTEEEKAASPSAVRSESSSTEAPSSESLRASSEELPATKEGAALVSTKDEGAEVKKSTRPGGVCRQQ